MDIHSGAAVVVMLRSSDDNDTLNCAYSGFLGVQEAASKDRTSQLWCQRFKGFDLQIDDRLKTDQAVQPDRTR